MTSRDDIMYIYGMHAVTTAIGSNPRAIDCVLFSQSHRDSSMAQRAKRAGIKVGVFHERTPPWGIPPGAPHQGVIAEVRLSRLLVPYHTFFDSLVVSVDTALVLLAEIQDPQNVGALIRSAAAFGAAGVLFPDHRQAPITGVVVKASAGAAFSVPLISIGNINATLVHLKEKGFWTYALSGDGTQTIFREQFTKPSVFVVGNEGYGVRVHTKRTCDIVLSIPIHARTESLNVSVALGVVLSQWSAQHPAAVQK